MNNNFSKIGINNLFFLLKKIIIILFKVILIQIVLKLKLVNFCFLVNINEKNLLFRHEF